MKSESADREQLPNGHVCETQELRRLLPPLLENSDCDSKGGDEGALPRGCSRLLRDCQSRPLPKPTDFDRSSNSSPNPTPILMNGFCPGDTSQVSPILPALSSFRTRRICINKCCLD